MPYHSIVMPNPPESVRFSFVGLLAVGALFLTGCGNPVAHKLEGRWLGESVENFDAKDMATATGWARGLSLEFSGSHLTVAVPAEEPRTGKYKVASVHDTDVQLDVTRADGTVDKASFKLDDDRSLRFMVGDTRAVVLRREP